MGCNGSWRAASALEQNRRWERPDRRARRAFTTKVIEARPRKQRRRAFTPSAPVRRRDIANRCPHRAVARAFGADGIPSARSNYPASGELAIDALDRRDLPLRRTAPGQRVRAQRGNSDNRSCSPVYRSSAPGDLVCGRSTDKPDRLGEQAFSRVCPTALQRFDRYRRRLALAYPVSSRGHAFELRLISVRLRRTSRLLVRPSSARARSRGLISRGGRAVRRVSFPSACLRPLCRSSRRCAHPGASGASCNMAPRPPKAQMRPWRPPK